MNGQNGNDNNPSSIEKNDVSLQEWLIHYDTLLEDLSSDKQDLYDRIKSAQNKVRNILLDELLFIQLNVF